MTSPTTGAVPAQRGQPPPEWRPGGELLPAEAALLSHAAAGEWLDLLGGGAPDLETMRAWGPERTVRAAVLRHLLIDTDQPVHAQGVQLRGARITGPLDLRYATLRCPLALDACYLDCDTPVNLTAATASTLSLTRCHLPAGIVASGLAVHHGFTMLRSTVHGLLDMSDAHITGTLSCCGVQLTANDDDGVALVADRMTVGGGVYLDDGFNATGAIRLPGADIKGQLSCSGAQLTGTNQDGTALVADGLTVTGSVYLNDGFTATGAIRLISADIKGTLDCSGAQLTGTNQDGTALIADGMTVTGNVFLNRGFTATGAIRLHLAHIRGQLECTGAQLTGTDQDGDALVADGLTVTGNVFLRDGFTAEGAVSLSEAIVGERCS